MKRCLFRTMFGGALWLAFCLSVALGQEVTMVAGESRQAGKYRVSLRLPEGGLAPGEEQQIEFRVVDTSREDPVLGPAAVIRAVIQSVVTMPEMPSMPKVAEIAHPEGVPGDYGLHPTFAHGGDYLLALKIAPRGDEPFTIEFPLKVLDEAPARKPRPKPYTVELKTEPGKVKAGEPARLRLTVLANRETRDAEGRPTGKRQTEQVKAFDLAHERQMHLIIVRQDLGFFAHVHPEPQPDGTFLLTGFAFPTAGEYRLFADTAPQGAGSQVLLSTLRVAGDKKPDAAAPATDRATAQVVNGVRVSLPSGPNSVALLPKKTALLTLSYRRVDGDAPVTDLEPYLGALGHMIMIHEDGQTFVHAHPDERDPQNGKAGSLTFLVRPPKAGRYRMWSEFQRAGQVNRAEFGIEVKEAGSVQSSH